ncbi:hypothetical protein [Loktanella sp. M215]|uniref:hypothetical protein n=1 Tax=Loktanella sp. M215 TaxID=2675431 RepID=UPI001F416B23|nr:hypothetical protein [Loktanella sp. M215]MCF7699941.1 hypothetical protein [Loktanella sp. M215]
MIYSLWCRRYAPFKTFGGGFEGDNRTGPSILMSDTARTTLGISFGPCHVGPAVASTSGTSYPALGNRIERLLGRHSSNVQCSVKVSAKNIESVRFHVSSAGSNPMMPGAPEIDTQVEVTANFTGRQIVLSGKVFGDNFPNGEIFIYDGYGKGFLLFHFETDGGQTTGPMTRLWGSHSNQRLGGFDTRIPIEADGRFNIHV